MKPRRGDPLEVFGRMMDGVIFPERAAVKHAVKPVQHEVGRDEKQYPLQPERKLRQRSMAVVVECDQVIRLTDIEEDGGAKDQQPDAEDARKYRHEEPVADVGNEFALAPPGFAGIAGPEMREHREYNSEPDRDRNDLRHRLAYDLDDFHWQIGHDASLNRRRQGYLLALKEP